MPDTELLNMLKITCEVIGDPHESRKFDSWTIEASIRHSYKPNKAPQNKTDKIDVYDNNATMPDYFRSSISRTADNKATEILTNKIHIAFSDVSIQA